MSEGLTMARSRAMRLDLLIGELSDLYAELGFINLGFAQIGVMQATDPTNPRQRDVATALLTLWRESAYLESALRDAEMPALAHQEEPRP